MGITKTLTAVLVLLSLATGARGEVVVRASVDSTAVTQGDRVAMHVRIVKDQPGGVVGVPAVFDEDDEATALPDGIEVREVSVDSGKVAGSTDRMQLNYTLLLQAFDPKIAQLPRLGFATADGDTVWGEDLSLKVNPVDLDTLKTVNPMLGTSALPTVWSDWIPDILYHYWWAWLGGLLLVAALIALAIMWKRNGRTLLKPKKTVPPYEWAMHQLERLREARLVEKGQVKEHYTHLVDILRRYLQGRFGINAMEMTSRQIVDTVQANDDTRLNAEQLKQLLEIADFVKFARVNPGADENVKAFNAARRFVEDTKPVDNPDDEGRGTNTEKP